MIVFVCPYLGFPNGMAQTARMTAFARGLVVAGKRVLLLSLGTSEIPERGILNQATKGRVDGIEFEYTSGATVRPDSFLTRRWLSVKGVVVASKRLISLSQHEEIEAIILFEDDLILAFWFWAIARLCKAVYLLEKSEHPLNKHPLTGAEGRLWQRAYTYFYLRVVYKLFDGVLVISECLRTYMAQWLRRGARIVRIPILVDLEPFASAGPGCSLDGRYVAYCGTLNQPKDGVITLMQAFASIRSEFPDIKLCLIGDSDGRASHLAEFRGHAQALGLADSVIFTGAMPRGAIPPYLVHATALALARPSSRQASAGFPTKLGEYLATGRPVVVTRTGEIDLFLQDNESVYFAPPDDVAAFADRLRYALSHLAEADQVGQKGLEIARDNFDYRVGARQLQDFVAACGRS